MSPLANNKKGMMEHASIKSGKYDTLKAMNASEATSKQQEATPLLNKKIQQP